MIYNIVLGDLQPEVARKIAEGDYCPISLAEMKDINPSFIPRPIKSLPLQKQDINADDVEAKNLVKAKTPTKGLLNFFL